MSTVDFPSSPASLAFEIPPTAVTLDGFRNWSSTSEFPDWGRVAFVDGRLLFDMSPERYESHLRLKREVTYVIENLVRQQHLGEVFIDGAWFTHLEANVSNEPDVMFATWDTLRSGRFRPADGKGKQYDEMVGTPDWVCEIVSDSSEHKDTTVLRAAYFAAGIPEYWLIDARGDSIDFKLLVADAGSYREVPPDNDGYRRSSVFGRMFLATRHEDELGRWTYVLEHC